MDPSGLSDAVLDSPVVTGKEMNQADIDKLNKGSDFYRDKLAKVASKPTEEWMRIIDGLNPGMLLEQIESVLPRNSMGGSSLWSYDGMRIEDVRQTMIWALDARHAVAVEIGSEGDRAWDADGKPTPRTKRYSNRITGRPLLIFHTNQLDDYGTLKREHCRLR